MKKTPSKPPKPLNIRQERFAEFVASGMPAMAAYVKAGYSNMGRNAESNASILMGHHGVKELIAVLKAKNSAKFEMKREALARHLWAAATTPIGEIDENHPLSCEVTTDMIAGGSRGKLRKGNKDSGNETVEPVIVRRRVKMQDKLGSARLLCEMMGWKEPEQMVVETGPKTLDAVRERARSMASAMARARVERESKST